MLRACSVDHVCVSGRLSLCVSFGGLWRLSGTGGHSVRCVVDVWDGTALSGLFCGRGD